MKKNLNSIGDVELAMNELQRKKAELDIKMGNANLSIAIIRDKAVDECSPIEEEIKRLESAVEAWAEKNRDDEELFPKGKKSFEFQAGTVAFRESAPSLELIDGWDADEVLEALRGDDIDAAIRKAGIKVADPSLDKTALKNLVLKGKIDNETLASLGLGMKIKESFSITLNTLESYL